MAHTEKTAASLVDEMVALDREQWCEVAEQLPELACAGRYAHPDGQTSARG